MTKGLEKRDKRLTLRIPSSVLEQVQAAAQEGRRSTADWVLLLIERELAARERRKRKG